MQNHQYSLSDLDNMLPWEREIYSVMLYQHLKEEAEKLKKVGSNAVR